MSKSTNANQALSPSEAEISQLDSMSESIEESCTSKSFDLFASTSQEVDENRKNDTEAIQDEHEESVETQDPQNKRKRKALEFSTSEVVEQELKTQTKICSELNKGLFIIKEYNSDIRNNIKKLCRSLDGLRELKKENLREQKRHDLEMEKLRNLELKATIDHKSKMLEIVKRKSKMMGEQNS